MTTGSKPSMPKAALCTWASCRKTSVTTTAVGTPFCSREIASCIQHEVQEPQSPIAVRTTSFSSAICVISSGAAFLEKLSFL